MSKIRCLTNNPMLIEKTLPFVEALPELSVGELYAAVQREILSGFQLLTHPITGSMGPEHNPYKSIILTGSPGKIDARSLEIMEQVIAFSENFTDSRMHTNWDGSVLKDFQMIDMDFIKGYLT